MEYEESYGDMQRWEKGVTSTGNSVKSEKSYGVYRGGQGISVQINDSDMVVDNYSPSDLFATGA